MNCNTEGYFAVLSIGDVMSGTVSFWKSGNRYYRQCIGLSKPKICSKKLYEKAKRIYEMQLKGDYRERI